MKGTHFSISAGSLQARVLPAAAIATSAWLIGGCPAEPGRSEYGRTFGSWLEQFEEQPGFDRATDRGANSEATEVDTAGLSADELAYLSLLFSRAGVPFDLANIPPDTDGDAIPNVMDPDVDGDGVENADDDDIDGDGQPNTNDDDIDGDGAENDDDSDIDADGIENDKDADADSDRLSDRFDLNDDGDDEPDDEDEDDEDDEPKTGLEDLEERLKNGRLSDADKARIVQEILDRLDSDDLKTQLQTALNDIVRHATDPNRQARPLTVPAGVDAIDQLYEQLGDAIKDAKRGQFDPNGPFQNRARERRAAEDMLLRAKAFARVAKTFPTMLIDDVNESVKSLRADLGRERLTAFTEKMQTHLAPNSIGNVASEKKELDALARGGAAIGKGFDDADADSIFDGIDRLRARARLATPSEGEDAKYDRLLGRLAEIKSESAGISLDDAVSQIETEDGGP
jgi:hypothetical protein